MEHFTPISSLSGGLLIGAAAVLVLATQGRIAGISGMCGAVLRPSGDGVPWRVAFLAGLGLVGLVASPLWPAAFDVSAVPSTAHVVAAGLLVGVGTRLGNGCTSGHGVCGVSRLSPRSIAATVTFMFTGGLTVFITRHVLAVGG